MEPDDHPHEHDSDPGFDARAFGGSFGPTAGGAFLIGLALWASSFLPDAHDAGLAIALFGSMGWLLLVFVLFLWCVFGAFQRRWRQTLWRSIGLVAGVTIGAGTCFGVLGM